MMKMITSIYSTESKNWLSIFVMIFISLVAGILIVYVDGVVAIGLFVVVMMGLFIKKIENIFLIWLLCSPLFVIDSLAFFKIDAHPLLTFDRVVIGAVFLFVLVEAALRRRNFLSMNSLEVAMILLSVVIVYSIIDGSVDKIGSARDFIDSFLYPFIIYFLAKNLISDEENFNKFINVLLIIGIYLCLMGIYEYFSGRDLLAFGEGLVERAGWLRVNGPYKHDSVLGVNVSFCFFIALYKIITSNNTHGGTMNVRKAFYGLILGLCILAIFFNFYRGIWVALIAGLLAWFVLRKKGLGKLVFSIILLTIIIIPIFSKLKTTWFFLGRLSNIETIQSRLNTFEEAIFYFKMNPIKGIGYNNYFDIGGSQHNTFLRFLSETGILGACVFMILVWFLFYFGFKNHKLSRGHLDNEFSIIFLCILITYSVTWIGLNTGFLAGTNKLFFAIAGASLGKMKRLY